MSITSLQVGAKFMISTGDQFYQSNNAGTYKTAFEGVVNLTDPRYSRHPDSLYVIAKKPSLCCHQS